MFVASSTSYDRPPVFKRERVRGLSSGFEYLSPSVRGTYSHHFVHISHRRNVRTLGPPHRLLIFRHTKDRISGPLLALDPIQTQPIRVSESSLVSPPSLDWPRYGPWTRCRAQIQSRNVNLFSSPCVHN